ncbi:glycosyltransferase family 2 protein [Pseudokordiimonas caeni]|uniref:glycosyltransferase family 2 protein n=1 Tax=Pseudokordiimonas caeni TaxID=2997908 RepID=UPI00281206A9|nr:glycosyltransferase family 2 protein [Pseudokordiimonas caeni]
MISVVTVCHNSASRLDGYVASFLDHHASLAGRDVFEFIFIENSGDISTEDHAEALRQAGFTVTVKMAENRGFGAGCNEGVALAKGETIAFINPDVAFQTSLAPLAESFAGNRWGTALQISHERGVNTFDLRPEYRTLLTDLARPHRWMHRCPPLLRFAYPVGSLFVVSRAAFDAVGGFDERFFLYYEEVELSRRLVEKFGPPLFCRDVKILHEGGASNPSVDFMLREEARSLILYSEIIGKPDLPHRRLATMQVLARLRPSLAVRVDYLAKALAERRGA